MGIGDGAYYFESAGRIADDRRTVERRPNIVFVVLDDVGFAQLGCYGSDLRTPTFDALAQRGLRFGNFHTTAVCSATRASLLTGRNHHRNGMGRVIELSLPFPGYNARIPRENGFLSEVLREAGYTTLAIGKWHLTPESECNMASTRERWPLSRGFDRFYGYMSGETHQFAPALAEDNHQIVQLKALPGDYHLTSDLVDHATAYIRDYLAVNLGNPFFLYFAPGACHSPHQAPPEYLESYRGQFSGGWDNWREEVFRRQLNEGIVRSHARLSSRPDWVPAWSDLTTTGRLLAERYMEAFAGYLTHTDAEVGRLLDVLEELRVLENTIVVLLSDNGASSEGGPAGSINDLMLWNHADPLPEERAAEYLASIGGPYVHTNYPWGWTVAGNTPFRRWKREVHEGGVADPLVLAGPGVPASRNGAISHEYMHVVDIMPTVLDLVGVTPPEVLGGIRLTPLDGVSFKDVIRDPLVESRRSLQYYEMFGNRAVYFNGWKAVTYTPFNGEGARPTWDEEAWEVYDLLLDPTETSDLAQREKVLVRELAGKWWAEAARNGVFPLDSRPFSKLVEEYTRPRRNEPSEYVYPAFAAQVPEVAAVDVKNRAHRVTARCWAVTSDTSGTLVSQGSALGGWLLGILDGKLFYLHSLYAVEEERLECDVEDVRGEAVFEFSFEPDLRGGGLARLVVNGTERASGPIARFTPSRWSLTGAGLTCGYSGPLPVCRAVDPPFAFTAGLKEVVIRVSGKSSTDPVAEAKAILEMQ